MLIGFLMLFTPANVVGTERSALYSVGNKSVITQHPKMLFRDMLYQSTDKLLR